MPRSWRRFTKSLPREVLLDSGYLQFELWLSRNAIQAEIGSDLIVSGVVSLGEASFDAVDQDVSDFKGVGVGIAGFNDAHWSVAESNRADRDMLGFNVFVSDVARSKKVELSRAGRAGGAGGAGFDKV